jgi:SHAQKYF class myb-like DNA-binding protein
MNFGYHDGVMPEQSSGINQNHDGGEYATAANTATASTIDPTLGGGSVVNDLMKVYENMTQSSTPQVPPSTHQGGQPTSSKYHIPPPMFNIPPMASTNQRPSQPNQNQQDANQQDPYHFDPPRQGASSSKQDDSVPSSIPSSIHTRSCDIGQQESTTLLHNDESDEQSSSKRRRRGSHSSANGAKSKKKSKQQDARWSKRFTWPEDLHRDFVSAIFDVGLKQASPSTILEQMPKHEQITTERIKSHLQKYRLHRAKSKKEFISTYEASLQKMHSQGGLGGAASIAGGELAAHLTYSESADSGTGGKTMSPVASATGASMDNIQMDGSASMVNGDVSNARPPQEENESIMLPELTEEEKRSPIGSAMGYLMGLFFSLRQQLLIQRSLESAQGAAGTQSGTGGGEAHIQDIYGSFATGSGAPGSTMSGQDLSIDTSPHQQAIPSMRTNIEENSIMKREMQNQMALQNKMRALKEQELAKYKNSDHGDVGKMPLPYHHFGGNSNNDVYAPRSAVAHMSDHGMSHGQGAGEMGLNEVSDATNHQRAHGLSFGTSAELWNSDVVDDQLFEFLMND